VWFFGNQALIWHTKLTITLEKLLQKNNKKPPTQIFHALLWIKYHITQKMHSDHFKINFTSIPTNSKQSRTFQNPTLQQHFTQLTHLNTFQLEPLPHLTTATHNHWSLSAIIKKKNALIKTLTSYRKDLVRSPFADKSLAYNNLKRRWNLGKRLQWQFIGLFFVLEKFLHA
jgi:hypothetical protein